MKFKDIKSLAKDEIEDKVIDLRKELFGLKMKNSVGQQNNPAEIKRVRRDIAKLLTVRNQVETKSN